MENLSVFLENEINFSRQTRKNSKRPARAKGAGSGKEEQNGYDHVK
jgi:hypothetical protein